METTFIHRVSKGTSFNQIYIPKSAEKLFKAGVLVEVKLIENPVFYSNGLKLNEFKKKLIQEIITAIQEFKEIEQATITGSFLTSNADYNDIDIILVSEKDLSEEAYNLLTEKFSLKFHVIALNKESFDKLIKIDPLTRSMFYYYASTESIQLPKKEIDKTHLKFLLMFPEDILALNIKPRTYYDSLRRLIAIERFLKNQDENPLRTLEEMKASLGNELFQALKQNEPLEKEAITKVKAILSKKLKETKRLINEQK